MKTTKSPMPIFTKAEIKALQRAMDIINAKTPTGSDAYENLVEAGCQPSTAAGTIGDILAFVERV
jgi:hypothetical protein